MSACLPALAYWQKDAVLIARLTAQLRCYVPEPVDETWGRLRYLGARREQLITEAGSQIQQMRDLLECVWPAALDTARQPRRTAARRAPAVVAVVTQLHGVRAIPDVARRLSPIRVSWDRAAMAARRSSR